MTTKITVERISADEVRVTLVADIRIAGNLIPLTTRDYGQTAAGSASGGPPSGARAEELLTVEQTAEVLHVSRDRIYYLLRSGRLRSIKIGKLRRISRGWIAEFIEQGASGSQHPSTLQP
jgi:excisionase family DNA binding protein